MILNCLTIIVLILLSSTPITHAELVNPQYLDELNLVKVHQTVTPRSFSSFFSGLFYSQPEPEKYCHYSVELGHVQDVSSSYDKDIDNLQELMPQFLEYVQNRHPESKFSFMSFTDKPIPQAGSVPIIPGTRVDHCLHIETTFDESVEDTVTALSGIVAGGGGPTWQEAQLDAMSRAVLSDRVGWSRQQNMTSSGLPIVKLLVIATDSIPNREGDAKTFVTDYNKEHPKDQYLIPVPSTMFEEDSEVRTGNANSGCATEDYPHVEEIARVFKENNILPVFLLAPGGYGSEQGCTQPGGCVWKPLRDLAKQTGNPDYKDPSKGMQLVYTELLKEMKMPGIIHMVNEEMSDFLESIQEALNDVEELICVEEQPTTTTTTTTTTTSTTTTSTTTTSTTTITTTSLTTATTALRETSLDATTDVPGELTEFMTTSEAEEDLTTTESHHCHHHHHHHHHCCHKHCHGKKHCCRLRRRRIVIKIQI